MTDEQAKRTKRRAGRWIFSLLLFVVLMTIRDESHSVWLRAVMAGCAFASFSIVISGTRAKS